MVEKITEKVKNLLERAPMWTLIVAAIASLAIEIAMIIRCYNQRTLLDQLIFVLLARVCEELTKELNNRNKKEVKKDEEDAQK